METERLHRVENRNAQIEKELETLKTDYRDITKVEQHLSKENTEQKDQLRIVNSNLQKQMEIGAARDRENNVLNNEVKNLRDMMGDFKQESTSQKEGHKAIIDSLRMQLQSAEENVAKVKETKEREFGKLREKCEEQIRRETDKY